MYQANDMLSKASTRLLDAKQQQIPKLLKYENKLT